MSTWRNPRDMTEEEISLAIQFHSMPPQTRKERDRVQNLKDELTRRRDKVKKKANRRRGRNQKPVRRAPRPAKRNH